MALKEDEIYRFCMCAGTRIVQVSLIYTRLFLFLFTSTYRDFVALLLKSAKIIVNNKETFYLLLDLFLDCTFFTDYTLFTVLIFKQCFFIFCNSVFFNTMNLLYMLIIIYPVSMVYYVVEFIFIY